MVRLRENAGERAIDGLPLGDEEIQHASAIRGQLVEPLGALVLLTPLAGQQALTLEAPQQRIQRAFFHEQTLVLEHPPQCVAVLLDAERREHRHSQAPAAELQPQVVEKSGLEESVTMRHILFATYYITHSN